MSPRWEHTSFHINGNVVGREVLAPGWTNYRARLYYQSYNVTASLHKGENVVGALLGDGWYDSGLITYQERFNFGPPPLRLRAQLEIEYVDSTRDRIISDPGWQASDSAVLRSDLYNGELYDIRPGKHTMMLIADGMHTYFNLYPAKAAVRSQQPIPVDSEVTIEVSPQLTKP